MTTLTKVTSDFDFLTGHFDVAHRALQPSGEWTEFAGTAWARTHFDGGVNVDEVQLPAYSSFGFTLRVYDPAEKLWSIYFVSSRTGQLQAPARGRWEDGVFTAYGEDEVDDKTIPVRLRWTDVTDDTAHWEQAYSYDGTWQTNWTAEFTRRATAPEPMDAAKVTDDFDFFIGSWNVHHSRLSSPLTGSDEWAEQSTSTSEAYTLFNGAVCIDEVTLPADSAHGMTVRLYDPEAGVWSIYWINSKRGVLEPPVHGGYGADGIGLFHGPDQHDGRPIEVRFRWTRGEVPVWQQFFSTDGSDWEHNWTMTFTRKA
jgi:hypothetical protein